MGYCISKNVSPLEEQAAIQRHKEIEQELVNERAQIVRKLLLLGAGECGKTTILKQMRYMHAMQGNMHAPFTEAELRYYRPFIFSMILTSMHVLVEAVRENMPDFLESHEYYRFQADAVRINFLIQNEQENQPLTKKVSQSIHRLWKCDAIQMVLNEIDELHLNDSIRYFVNDLERICGEQYVPSIQDVLNVRSATIGVQEVKFALSNGQKIRVFDVGGQKSQRRKWIHIFDDVDAVIFIVAISEFNQLMSEDNATNRLVDALSLFKEVTCNQYLLETASILFLNKTDLFREKLQQNKSIKTAFPDYKGDNSYSDSIGFLSDKFKTEGLESAQKKIIVHETCAVDTGQMQAVLNGVTDIVVNKEVGEWFLNE